jgi:peptidoglycan/LPS O-acetylase OafA/YrhL
MILPSSRDAKNFCAFYALNSVCFLRRPVSVTIESHEIVKAIPTALHASPPRERLPLVEVARVVAAIAIIWIHAVESPQLTRTTAVARFAVPFFVITSLVFLGESLRRRPDQRWSEYARRRFMRLYVPFLVWSVIYILARAVKHLFVHDTSPLLIRPNLLWAGVTEQLWFLPFLLVVLLIAFPLTRFAIQRNLGWITAPVGLAVCVGALFVPSPDFFFDGPTTFFVQTALLAVPSAGIGLALAGLFPQIKRVAENSLVALIFLMVWIGTLVALEHFGRNTVLETFSGLCLMLACLAPISGAKRFDALGPYAFGIYLCHVLWIEFLQAIGHRAGLYVSIGFDVAVMTLATILSIALVASILRSKVASRLLLP